MLDSDTGLDGVTIHCLDGDIVVPEESDEPVEPGEVTYISRLFGASRYETAIAISDEGWWFGADTVVLANGLNYADALAGVPLAFANDAPILLTAGKASLEAVVAEQIENLGASKIILLGGAGAISEEIENSLAENYEVERVFGLSRYETAVEIGMAIDPAPETAVVVTGTGYADALAISPLAAMKNYPIVYSNPNTGLSEETLAYLENTENIYIVGGEGVVRQNTVDQLGDRNIERIFGAGRYETALAIAEKFDNDFAGDGVMFATGTNFPDALAGGVLGAKLGAPLLLTHPSGAIEGVRNYVLEKDLSIIYLLGGEGAVPDSVIDNIYA